MVVKTINPVIVNGNKESRLSKYLSFDANGKPEKTKPNEVKSFQNFANSKGAKLVVDGKWGSKSESAWSKYGADYVSQMKSIGNTVAGVFGGTSSSSSTTTEPSKEEQIAKAKEGKIWDKAKGWIQSEQAKDLLAKLQGAGGVQGLWGSIKDVFGGGTQSTGGTGSTQTSSEGAYGSGLPDLPSDKPKWSTGKKIAVFGGGALVLGLVIYFATRPKTGK